MAYQGPDGQWYDDNGEPILNPAPPPTGEILGGSSSGAQGLPNEPANFDWSSIDPGKQMRGFNPDGTPHYVDAMPGYSQKNDPYQGSWQFSGPGGTGSDWSWLSNAPKATTSAPPASGSTPEDWAAIARSMFGSMPSVGQYTPPPFSYDAFSAPAPFSAPNGQDVLNADPGYQFRVNQGLGAMQNSAAARGVLNTGGTLQDLVDYGQNSAAQEYNNAYNRSLGTYQTNYNDALQNYITGFGSALTKYNSNYNTNFLTPYNQLMGQYGQGVANQAQIFGERFNTATA